MPSDFRYLGIDLHSRTRRRVLVTLTWTVLLLGIAALDHALDSVCALNGHPALRLMIVLMAALLFGSCSVFRTVNTSSLFPTQRRSGRKVVLLTNLHDRALYKYGAPFDDLPEEQQQELLRSYRVGNYYFPSAQSKAPKPFGRRKITAGNQATASALKRVTGLCIFGAGMYAAPAILPRPEHVAMTFLMIGIFAVFAPQSSALWSEPDLPSEDRAPLERTSMPEQTSS
jgi:hypothetical protein